MPRIKTGYSKNILAHGKCRIINYNTSNRYILVEPITLIMRPDGTRYYAYNEIALVNKDEVSNIKEEEV